MQVEKQAVEVGGNFPFALHLAAPDAYTMAISNLQCVDSEW